MRLLLKKLDSLKQFVGRHWLHHTTKTAKN